MRQFILMIICLLPVNIVFAQNQAEFTCLNTHDYRSQLTIIPPELSASLPDVSVRAMGQGNHEPVIGITTTNEMTDCYLSMPVEIDNTIINSAEGLLYDFGENTIQLSELNGEAGQVRLVFEALMLESEHTYRFNFNQAMDDNAGENSTIYLVSLSETFTPSFTITDSQGTQIEAEAVDISTLNDFSEGFSAVSAQLSMLDDELTLTINPNQIGVYALILDINVPQVPIDDGIATVTRLDEGAIALECDDETVFENGLEVILPDDNIYKATALANNIDTILAIIDGDDSGLCYDNTPTANYYFADLPSATMTPNQFNAQASTPPNNNERVVFGGHNSADGDYVLIIEGGTLMAENEGDIFEVSLTPQMQAQDRLLRAYVFAIDATLNPILTWEDDTGDLLRCDSAGVEALCDQDLEDFSSASLALGFNQRLLSLNNNPMLEIPVNNLSDASTIRLRVTAGDATSGAYVLVLHLVTD